MGPQTLRIAIDCEANDRFALYEQELLSRGGSLALGHRSVWYEHTNWPIWVATAHDDKGCCALLACRIERIRALPGHFTLRIARVGAGAGANDAALRALLTALRDEVASRQDVVRMELELFSFESHWRTRLGAHLRELGFCRAPKPRGYLRTARVSLKRSEDKILAGFHPTARRHIRAISKRPVELRTIVSDDEIPAIERIYQATLKRTNGDAATRPWKALMALSRSQPELIRVVGLYRAGTTELLAFACGHAHGSYITYADAGSTRPADLKVPMGYALAWDLMRWGRELGMRWFDFGGMTQGDASSGDPLGGISDFKRYFRGEQLAVTDEWMFEPHPRKALFAQLSSGAFHWWRNRKQAQGPSLRFETHNVTLNGAAHKGPSLDQTSIEAWEQLCERSPFDCCFARPQWVLPFAEAFEPRPLQLVFAYQQDELVGVFPMTPSGLLEGDHLPEMHIALDRDALPVLQQWLAWWAHQRAMVKLPKLGAQASSYHSLLEAVRNMGAMEYERNEHHNHHTDVQGDWPQFLKARSKNFRKQVKKALRAADAHHLSVQIIRSAEALEALLPELEQVSRASWQGKAGTGTYSEQTAQRFYKQIMMGFAALGKTRLITCRRGDELIGYFLYLLDKPVLHALKSEFRQDAPECMVGWQISMAAYQLAVKEKAKVITSGYWATDFKKRWTTRTTAQREVTLFSASLNGARHYLVPHLSNELGKRLLGRASVARCLPLIDFTGQPEEFNAPT